MCWSEGLSAGTVHKILNVSYKVSVIPIGDEGNNGCHLEIFLSLSIVELIADSAL